MPTDPTAADHRRRADELRRYADHLDADAARRDAALGRTRHVGQPARRRAGRSSSVATAPGWATRRTTCVGTPTGSTPRRPPSTSADVGRVVGYEPARIGVLVERAHAVVAHLAAARCADPAAADAVRTSAAVLGQRRRAVAAGARPRAGERCPARLAHRGRRRCRRATWFDDLRSLHGSALGVELAARAAALPTDEFDELQRAIVASSRRHRGDDRVRDRPRARRRSSPSSPASSAPRRPRPPTSWRRRCAPRSPPPRRTCRRRSPTSWCGRPPTAAATVAPTATPPGVALGYLFDGPQLPTAFLVPAMRTAARRRGGGRRRPGPGRHRRRRRHPVGVDVDADARQPAARRAATRPGRVATSPTPRAAFDPAYAILRQLGHDGAAGRALFADRATAAYFFAQRPVTEDHGRAVTAAAAAAAATDGVVPARVAGHRARRHVRRVGVRERLRPAPTPATLLDDVDDEVSGNVAAVIGRHLPSVHLTVVPGTGSGGAPEPVGVVTSMHEVLGPSGPRVRAQFDPDALDAMLDLAANAPAGVRRRCGRR